MRHAVRVGAFFLTLGAWLSACSGEPPDEPKSNEPEGEGGGGGAPPGEAPCASDAECGAEAPHCDLASGTCAPLPPGHELGLGDGSPGSVDLTVVLDPEKSRTPTDLEFNPSKPHELWVVHYDDDSVTIVTNPGTPEATSERKRDPAASHFMDKPPGIAFGAVVEPWGQTFGVCGDNDNGGNDFMGPALFPAEPEVFAKQTPDGLGSHLDMLHSTTFCRGIAHERDNVYWVFNSNKGSLDRYDFAEDHGPGNDDHSDGRILRYVAGMVAGVDGVSSHLAFDAEANALYVADTGNKRVAKLDVTSGTPGAKFGGLEPVEERRHVDGAVLTDVVSPGVLEAPSGVEHKGGLLYVSDHATSRLHAFDAETGELLRSLDTGLPPGSLSGLAFGPDGKIYFVDRLSGRVYRVDPR